MLDEANQRNTDSGSLLLALSQAAQTVQRAHTQHEIYKAVGDEIRSLGYSVIILRMMTDANSLVVDHMNVGSGVAHSMDKGVGAVPGTVTIPYRGDSIPARVITTGESIYCPDIERAMRSVRHEAHQDKALSISSLMGFSEVILAPLSVASECVGVLGVAGSGLDRADLLAVTTFANQIGIALENAQLLEQIRSSERKFRSLSEEISDGVAVSVQSKLCWTNDAFDRIFGFSSLALIEKDIEELFPVPLDIRSWPLCRPIAFEATITGSDGKPIFLSLSVKSINFAGSPALQWIVRDVTENKQIEAAMNRYQQDLESLVQARTIELLESNQQLTDQMAERRRIESQLGIQREQFLLMISNLPEVLYVSDPETFEIVFVNDVLKERLGFDPVGKLCYKEFHGLDAPCSFCNNDLILKEKRIHSWEFYNANLDSYFYITDQIIQWPDGRDLRFEVAVDISRRKRAEKVSHQHTQDLALMNELNDASNRHAPIPELVSLLSEKARAIFGAQGFSVYLVSDDGHDLVLQPTSLPRYFVKDVRDRTGGKDLTLPIPLDAENPYARIMACPETLIVTDPDRIKELTSFIGYLDHKKLPEVDWLRSMITRYLEEMNVKSVMLVPMVADEMPIGLLEIGIRESFTESDLSRLTAIASQLTALIKRRKAEIETERYALKLERSNQELENFAYIASHDLQEPLRKIQAFGDRLFARYGDELGERGHDYLVRMQGAARRGQRMVNDLLTYSRVSTRGQPFEQLDLERVLEDVLLDLETRIEETDATITIGKLPRIEADPTQMRQLFQNLLGNALKFSRVGIPPCVEISARNSQGNLLEISVKDNGIGFEEKYLARIFLPFQRLHGRTEYEGSGVGLAICFKIAERHGGEITAKSQPGEGSTFTVKLPEKQVD